jgi:hypothetical protein
MRQLADSPPQVVRSDTVILPINDNDPEIPPLVAAELNKAVQKEPPIIAGPAGHAPNTGDDINAKMFAAARTFVGHITSNVPGTQHGNLACAWAVNEVARLALGKPISTSDGVQNGLSTDGLFDVLEARHDKLNTQNDAKPGTIIIAPTEGVNHGHVGIVGATTSTVGNTQVFSNKSVPGVFLQNFTIDSFINHYTSNGLRVFFFALEPNQFMTAPSA